MVEKNLIYSAQDDDQDTDEEVLENGIRLCRRDLLVLRDYMKQPIDLLKSGLRTT